MMLINKPGTICRRIRRLKRIAEALSPSSRPRQPSGVRARSCTSRIRNISDCWAQTRWIIEQAGRIAGEDSDMMAKISTVRIGRGLRRLEVLVRVPVGTRSARTEHCHDVPLQDMTSCSLAMS